MSKNIKQLKLKCGVCGAIWVKHFKQVEFTQSTGKGKATLVKWQPSKEFHVCKPKPEIERKDWS